MNAWNGAWESAGPGGVRIRTTTPRDHRRIVEVCDDWWGRPVAHILPRLFLDHFHTTCLVADDPHLAGFLVGFPSPSLPEEAYVHFAGVAPDHRRTGLARELYRLFVEAARTDGRTVVRAVTSPANERSIAFHRSVGFTVTGPHAGYDGPGNDRMCFTLRL
ncbi:GNAT family N-acetyltransferase [Nocardiopsis sp. MG754419]|uniref:GNAT family N-acetyltransferase n=1 Tax=Nocardiopsis sp. MG754419 TaxID=2259865 RepID=UPI001BA63AB9|nr:GNAT family N-acetyltransferase [Nocardiopsis sp. MG754419]MBR8744311.1 GNAT family N-acetyltransferase [Nocardiopsis sp. MG754419]